MTLLRRLVPLALLAVAVRTAAEEGVRPVTESFRYARVVTPGAAGPNRLAVDGALLSGSGARAGKPLLGDLRLFAADGREVPYLLVAPVRREPAWVRASLLPIPETKSASGFEADLGALRRIDRLRVSGLAAPFLKRLRLEGSGDRARWTLLVAEGTLFDLPEEGLALTEVAFPEGEHRFLRLAWNDARSGRVPLPSRVEARLAGTGGAPEPLRVAVPFERRASEPGKSRYRLRLDAAGLPIAAIEVAVASGNVLRDARVLESRLAGGRLVPFELGAAMLRRAERDDAAAAEMAIRLALAPAEAELEFLVEDAGNPPLDVTSITALYEGLPWIYFESADGSPLTARFGAARLAAPRYDLEALRPAITRQGGPSPASASWGDRQPGGAVAGPAAAGASVPSGAALDLAGFRFSRPIPQGPAGLTALLLDAAVLSVSPHLSDVRIAAADGRQVPYLLETLGEPLVLKLPVPQKADDPRPRSGAGEARRVSFHRLELPFDRLPGARLELETTSRVFTRRVALLRERIGGRPESSGTFPEVASATWEAADPERNAPALLLDLPADEGRELFVSIDDGDNAAVPLVGASLLLPAQRLRFVREAGAELTLVYGQGSLAAPRYDLELLAPRLLGAPAVEAALAPAVPGAPEPEAKSGPKLFWAALVGAVVALLVLVARLLRREPVPETAEKPKAGKEGPGEG
ncbi:MAG: DUF3999 family protein [Holophagales bacterium]|jgi:hypothetical protein|nr:DUF3999 family protein [Holophagales bacterium]MBK9967465.1 DUF3999 family protein [Holophagales bacterium]